MYSRQNSIAVILDDHKLFADSLAALIGRMEIFQSVKVFTDENTLTQFFIRKSDPQNIYFFVDYLLKERDSIPVISDARRLNKRIKVIVITSITDPVLIQNILLYNPDGFLSKSSGFNEILECVRMIEDNKIFLSPFVEDLLSRANKISSSPFTTREIELLQYFNQGYSIAGTAEKINLSKHTVVAHRRHMMEKAGCSSITELLAFSRKRGLIQS